MPIEGLRMGDVIRARQFGCHNILSIRIVSDVVASGGYADILKGEVQSPGQLASEPQMVVAIKVITVKRVDVDQERIRRELTAATLAQHRHILPFIAALHTETYTILVSRFMGKGNMAEYLKADHGAQKEPLILEVSDAVDYLHTSLKLVHGDLKCQNVLVSDDEHALLTDFGLSTTAVEAIGGDPTLTAIRASMTLRFAAPEIILETATSPSGKMRSKTTQTDVYAFGMLIVQAFTGTHPWPGETDASIYLNTFKKSHYPRPAKSLEIGLTDPWWQLCETCLKYEPKQRASMADICSSIKVILDFRGGSVWLDHRLSGSVRGLTDLAADPKVDQVTSNEAPAMTLNPLAIASTDSPPEAVPNEAISDAPASRSSTDTLRAAGSVHSRSSGRIRERDPDPEAISSRAALFAALSRQDASIAHVIVGIVRALGRFDKVITYPNQIDSGVSRVRRLVLGVFGLTVECDSAPRCYGVLRSDAVRHMDNVLKVAVAETARAIRKIEWQSTWPHILNSLDQNPFLRRCIHSDVTRTEMYTVDRSGWLLDMDEHVAVTVKEVQAWLAKLMIDPDISNLKHQAELVDPEAVASILGRADATIDISKLDLHGKVHSGEKKFLDITILRYPDAEVPFIKLYRIELRASYNFRSVWGRAHVQNSISGVFDVKSFMPNEGAIESMRPAVMQAAFSEAENLLQGSWE